MSLRELLERRANLVSQAREIVDLAEGEGRNLRQDEEQRYDALMTDVTDLGARVERQQRVDALERDLERPLDEGITPTPGETRRLEFRSRGLRSLNDVPGDQPWIDQAEWRRLVQTTEAGYDAQFRQWLYTGAMAQELRALQADSDTLGGYLVTPLQLVDRLIQAVDNAVYIRQWATTFAVPNAESLGAPSLDTDPADPTWTSELAIGSEDSSMAFGRRELNPHPLAKYIKVSRKLLRKVPDVESLVVSRLAYKFAVTFENALLNGSGSNQPLGVFTASNDGISTGRDVSTQNTTTSMTFDGLINVKYTLKGQYWPMAKWLFHRDGVKQIAKLKDGNSQYIWRESVRVGDPDRILGLPVFMSEYAPNTFTTGLYVGILGDFSYVWIADSLSMEMQRLVELYAATNQVGLIGRLESDGLPVLEEAFVRVKLA